jgi:AhpC/TSA family
MTGIHEKMRSLNSFHFSRGDRSAHSECCIERLNQSRVPERLEQTLHGTLFERAWTDGFTCINWLRTLPYVRAWTEKYKDKGLIVIGVHSPEFEFEKTLDDVRHAVEVMNIDYPVAVDSDHAIWRAFRNSYWPALYFVDAQGLIRHHQFGEGNYEQSERIIQQLLVEAGGIGIGPELVTVDARGVEAAADVSSLRSPENLIWRRGYSM